ncbi:glycosyltransferase [Pseudarthrobacter sp. NIBRBAC000502770]|uniref:glycosyltransferase n=1 Tax=Pseudarthrobacter sp. NIBRBAC000502770 TaxID=2590785 RepID=UPI00113FF0EB|nr:glycosyltransferase [Pseudarthrobacter sp. NIBRBAC000502770]QDG89417.1 glycosyltransferase [Pseudarthrobacter sp. NIBRBAC000502770]
MLTHVAAVVVHHRSYASVGGVVDALLMQGVLPQNILVVDNSEEPERRSELRETINAEVDLEFTPNNGYAAAVNHSIAHFSNRTVVPDYLLVSTHETQPAAGAVSDLYEALEGNPRAAVAGPTLISGIEEEYIWSTGGYIDRLTGVPAHYGHRESLEILHQYHTPIRRQWLDGAFLLYRWKEISERTVPEGYFLYMEETDLHLTLGRDGYEVLWVPTAKVWQQSGGIPPYFFARNIRLFLREHGGFLRARIVPPLMVARKIVADVVRRREVGRTRDYLRGLSSPLPLPVMKPLLPGRVHIINPLGAALLHYENELCSVLRETGHTVSSTRFLEPSASRQHRLNWLAKYLSILLRARFLASASKPRIIVVWPVLGYLDVALVGILGLRNVAVVVHDPVPLVRSVGYSNRARRFASIFQNRVGIIAHSNKAQEAIASEDLRFNVDVLPHPILDPVSKGNLGQPAAPIVRVLGQYKADRDIQALRALGEDLSRTVTLEVYGRGWPAVEGWRVVEGFVDEARLDDLLADSSAVLIPYKRFFQSGIAIRALEAGTPFVGPRDSVLAEMVGDDSALLVDTESRSSWQRAVDHAIAEGPEEAWRAAKGWREANIREWSAWMQRGNWVSNPMRQERF